MSSQVIVLTTLIFTTLATAQTPPQTAPPASRPANSPRVDQPSAAKPADDATKVDATRVTAPAAVDPHTFKIGAEDVILIQVWREPDFTRSAVVRPDGKITMPLVGEITAAGLTPIELGKSVGEALTKYLNNPDVNITVLQVNSKKYYIIGEVNRPGAFPLITPTRLLEALTNAGGFHDFANTKNITILRKGKKLKFNYKEVIHGEKMDQNIYVEDGDYIVVP
jgi:polysaccharide export outer membrane protein